MYTHTHTRTATLFSTSKTTLFEQSINTPYHNIHVCAVIQLDAAALFHSTMQAIIVDDFFTLNIHQRAIV